MSTAHEILLSPEELSAGYTQLKPGEKIEIGHFFQERAGERKLTGEGMKFRFLRVEADTFVNGIELAGIEWKPSYPIVLRELPKVDPFAAAGEDAQEFFVRASRDLIRGEMIHIRVLPDGTLASDKLDFTGYNSVRTRSIATMVPTSPNPPATPQAPFKGELNLS
ncbi:MAG: hypothetical protein V4773_27840 [Verrucomicrobiota bacterium]